MRNIRVAQNAEVFLFHTHRRVKRQVPTRTIHVCDRPRGPFVRAVQRLQRDLLDPRRDMNGHCREIGVLVLTNLDYLRLNGIVSRELIRLGLRHRMGNCGKGVHPQLGFRRSNKVQAKSASDGEDDEQRDFEKKKCFHQFVNIATTVF